MVIAARRTCLGADSPSRWVAISLNAYGQIYLDGIARPLGVPEPEPEAQEAMGQLVSDGPSTVKLTRAADHRWSSCAMRPVRCPTVPSPRSVTAGAMGTASSGTSMEPGLAGWRVRGGETRPGQHGFDGRDRSLVGLLGDGARGEERLAVDPEMDKAAGGH